MKRDGVRAREWVLAVGGALAAVLILVDVGGPFRAVAVLSMLLVVPGWALVRHVRGLDLLLQLIYTVITSGIILGALSLAMVWTRWWHPTPVAVGLLIAAAASTVLVPARRTGTGAIGTGATGTDSTGTGAIRRWRFPTLRTAIFHALTWATVVAAVVFWIIALLWTDTSRLGAWGLLSAFPVLWYVAVALILGICVLGITSALVSRNVMVVSITTLTVMLYASANLTESAPRLPWVYKHIAVTRYIDATGGVDVSIDVYNRWPGFFATSAFAGDAMGYPNPVSYAAWAEIGFVLVSVAVVLAIARTLSQNPSVYWTATLVFVLGNWVGQNYYSPQAFAFTFYLAMCLTALRFLRATPVRLLQWLERRVTRKRTVNVAPSSSELPRERGTAPVPFESRPSRRNVVITGMALLLMQALIVASHQLTPYVAVLTLTPLFFLGYFRPKWLGLGIVGLAVAFLIPNLEYVESNFGLFTGFDPVANATFVPPQLPRTDAEVLQSRIVVVLSGIIIVLGFAGFARQVWRGNVRTAVVVTWLAVSPALLLFGQTYGGEAKFRIYLFALPWCALGVAWLFARDGPSGRLRGMLRAAAMCSTLTLLAVLFCVAYFQPEADSRISRSDVRAAEWLDARIGPADSVITATGNVPILIGPNYRHLLEWPGVELSMSNPRLNDFPHTSADDLLAFIRAIAADDRRTFIVLSAAQEDYARRHAAFDPGVLDTVERTVAADPDFAKVYSNDEVRIYASRS